MDEFLENPVVGALRTGDAAMNEGSNGVYFFHPEVSPFAGFDEGNEEGFDELHRLMPEGRKILYATRGTIGAHRGWQEVVAIKGLQFVFRGSAVPPASTINLVPLTEEHVPQMVALATLTKPGPFGNRTIEFGHYYGVFHNNELVAMTGQRLHAGPYSEISAVCTHPDHLGKGYAAALMQQQLQLICNSGRVPFLHVREDNERAIEIYKRLSFEVEGPMNFYFLKRL